MKDQILKIAGVKNEAEFYRKFPSEEAFMKAHKKEFKKAAMGASMVKKQLTQLTDFSNPPQARVGDFVGPATGGNLPPAPAVNFTSLYDANDLNVTGKTDQKRMAEANLKAQQQQAAAAQKTAEKGNGFDIGKAMEIGTQAASMMGKNGKRIPSLQTGGSPSQGLNTSNEPSKGAKFNKYLGPAGKILDGIEKLKAEKKALAGADQFAQVSDVVSQASGTRPEQARRRYVRPEDQILNAGELYNPYGAGTNYLAKNGAEIQNTYAPNDIYSDLGYEPLNDSVKQYRRGGYIPIAQSGFSDFAGSPQGSQAATAVGDFGSTFAGGEYGESNAGGDIGGEVGSSIGSIFGPPGAMIGRAVGDFAGRLLDKNPQRTRAFQQQGQGNLQRSAFQQGAQQIQAQNAGYMEDGGWMNPEYNPQVITKFGNVDVSDVHNIFTEGMDNLRSGGHLTNYTPPSEEAMQTYAMGGELQTHWGGHMEPMSYNPYLPGDGITYMPRGQSHDETNGQGQSGIGITYGENPVEVERGEPITKLQDGGTGEDNIMVYGNMKIPSYGISELQDKNAKNMKFKHYAKDLSKDEARQNKIIDKSTKLVNSSNDSDPFGQLAFASGQASLIGANMKLKNIADKKQILAGVQNAILDTAKEHGLVADELAKGKIVKDKSSPGQAMYGAKMETAQTGKRLPPISTVDDVNYFTPTNEVTNSQFTPLDYSPGNLPAEKNNVKDNELNKLYEAAKKAKKGPAVLKFQKRFHELHPDIAKQVIANEPVTSFGKNKKLTNSDLKSNEDGEFGKRTIAYKEALDNQRGESVSVPIPNFPKLERINYDEKAPELAKTEGTLAPEKETTKKKNWLTDAFDIANTFIPRFRGTNQEELNPNQLGAEMYSLATNQLEPVQAQMYQPRLQQPYDISYQDMLNANQSDFNAVQRQVGGNPAALAALAAQKYGANEKVLGEQFRANQAQKAGVYNQNLQTLNDATLKNLAILDQQYTRQSQAKSNTKAQAQAALQSIASKIAQNKLENRKVAINENLYNYRFDPITGRALNRNELQQFNMQGNPFGRTGKGSVSGIPSDWTALYDETGEFQGTKKKTKSETSRNGSIVKALKNL